MRRALLNAPLLVGAMSVIVIVSGCGAGGAGGGSTTTAEKLTSAQVTGIASETVHTFILSADLMSSNLCDDFGLKPGQVNFCAIPVSNSVLCTQGGLWAVTGSLNVNVDFTESGASTLTTIASTPTNCVVKGTSLTVNADNPLQVTGLVNFFYGGVNLLNVTETGTLKYGSSPSGSCPVNLNTEATIDGSGERNLLTCTMTGTACGQTINQSCMTE